MMIKSGILALVLMVFGTAFGQETELEVPPPPPPIEKKVEERIAVPPVPRAAEYQPPIQKDEIVDFPDVEAEYPGGTDAMKKFIQDNVQYPAEAVKNKDQGRVYVTFIIEKDGSISGVDVMRGGVTPAINAEAKRLVRAMPNWIPAEDKGEKVRARCRLPITFTL